MPNDWATQVPLDKIFKKKRNNFPLFHFWKHCQKKKIHHVFNLVIYEYINSVIACIIQKAEPWAVTISNYFNREYNFQASSEEEDWSRKSGKAIILLESWSVILIAWPPLKTMQETNWSYKLSMGCGGGVRFYVLVESFHQSIAFPNCACGRWMGSSCSIKEKH